MLQKRGPRPTSDPFRCSDRVMVVRAKGLPGPATGMDDDPPVRSSGRLMNHGLERPRSTLQQAFSFAEQVRRLHAQACGRCCVMWGRGLGK